MLLELKNIHKSFRSPHGIGKVKAVDGVSLSIQAGENLALVGESGSGKTTLGRLALRLYAPDEGSICFDGKELTHLSQNQLRLNRRAMQMVFQDPWNSLDPRFSIQGILGEALCLATRLTKKERIQKMEEVLAAVALPQSSLGRFPHELSGGERQRVAIARSLLMQPQLLILDEAVSSLDVLVQEQILKLLRELQGRYAMTYWLISHNLRAVRKICQRVAVMCQGRIVEMAKTEDLFLNPIHPYTQMLLSAAMEYKVKGPDVVLTAISNSQLIDQGNGHFVLI